ncbi:MAG: ribosome-associated translation inhibitor RaiA [Bacteroidota bacterium]|nr:ribosome-associated translation inhibitor RaiA [Bacteroidota bacterium]MDX5427706.1 ribosome-associated translation inhibitor RaiA [Bacteroidota bacterium]MDX5447184.1 ribosome-associated translation inhibitor RaiA [Bacteroidota bacterium]MDX5505601.1 ribosome-associated translation inhibitor RaiA [Bacteroidota bacterium]
MKINVQSVNFNADQKLIDFIQRKLDKLDQFYDRIIEGDVYMKLDNNHKKENKIVEVKLSIPGNDLVAKKECTSFEEAADLVTEALGRQLRKRKEKVRGV